MIRRSIAELENILRVKNLFKRDYFEGIRDSLAAINIIDNYFGWVKKRERNGSNGIIKEAGRENGNLLAAIITYLPNIKDPAYKKWGIFDKSSFGITPIENIDFKKHIETLSSKSRDGSIIFDEDHMSDDYIVFRGDTDTIAFHNLRKRFNFLTEEDKRMLDVDYLAVNEKIKRLEEELSLIDKETGLIDEQKIRDVGMQKYSPGFDAQGIETVSDILPHIIPRTYSDPEGKELHVGAKSEAALMVPLAIKGAVTYLIKSTVFKNGIGKVIMCGWWGVDSEVYLDNIPGLDEDMYLDKEKSVVVVKKHYRYNYKTNKLRNAKLEIVHPAEMGLEEFVKEYAG